MSRTIIGSLVLLIGATLTSIAGALPQGAAPLVSENQLFQPSDWQHEDLYGRAVAVEGSVAMIGAVHGNVASPNTGSVYVYDRVSSGFWSFKAELISNDPFIGHGFGASIAMDGHLAVIGAPADTTFGPTTGAAYVFERRVTGNWTQVAKLLANDGSTLNAFGQAVGISGNQIVIGAPRNDSAGTDAGAAYVFTQDLLGQWNQTTKLTASNATNGAEFGTAVDIDGGRIVVGAPGHQVGAVRSGGAYVYEQMDPGVWNEAARLVSDGPQESDQFGLSASIDGSIVAVGSHFSRPIGSGNLFGAAFMFERSALGEWELDQRIQSDYVTNGNGQFGRGVEVNGFRVLIGAEDHFLAAGTQGGAYLYQKGGSGEWIAVSRMVGTGSTDGWFGIPLGMDGTSAFVGAPFVEFDSGRAYFYDIGAPIPEPASCWLAMTSAASFAGMCRRRKEARQVRSFCAAAPRLPP